MHPWAMGIKQMSSYEAKKITGTIFSLQTLTTTEVRLYCLIITLPHPFPFE